MSCDSYRANLVIHRLGVAPLRKGTGHHDSEKSYVTAPGLGVHGSKFCPVRCNGKPKSAA